MSAPLRIASHPNLVHLGPAGPSDSAKEYVERLVRLIPAEIVGLYLGGKSAIEGFYSGGQTRLLPEPTMWLVWTVVCLIALVLVRGWGTSDQSQHVPPEWGAIAVAAVSFLVWIYSFGDVFQIWFHIWDPLLATLLVYVWTFATPYIYRKT